MGVQKPHVSVKNVLDFKVFFYLQDNDQYHVSIMLSCDQMDMENKFYILLINTSGIQLMCDANCGFHETPNLGLERVVLTSGTGTPRRPSDFCCAKFNNCRMLLLISVFYTGLRTSILRHEVIFIIKTILDS